MSFLSEILDTIFASPKKLGKRGENAAARKLDWVDFCGYRGKILRNVYVPRGNRETTEIDLLYITRKGIFVIESKNYSGYIFGSERNKNWTATLYAGKNRIGQNKVEKHSFYNPIWQNRTHINYLRKFIRHKIPMFSIIVFSSRCKLKEIDITSPDVIVCQQNNLSHYIKKTWRTQVTALTDSEIEELYHELLPLTMASRFTKKKHVADIQARINNTEICPRCGGKLVIRTAKTGPCAGQEFYGCSNYPRCKYTKNV